MNLVAKCKSLQAQVDELRARVEALEVPKIPEPTFAGSASTNDCAEVFYELSPKQSKSAKTMPNMWRADAKPLPPLQNPIDVAEPIACDTIRPPARKRGRPPKA